MRYYLISGEASGDLHGSNLIKALKINDKQAEIRCWGGDLMQAAGGTVVKHYKELAFMGFVEVLANLSTIIKNLKFCKKDILEFKPDVLVLIDYPGFNIRIAEWAFQQNIKVIYYISPQVWAWKAGRVKTLKRCVNRMLTILPFEKAFYKNYGWDVDYVGHPLVEVTEQFIESNPLQREQNIIALLPGSRKQEVLKKLPVMLEVSKQFPQYRFIVARTSSLPESLYDDLCSGYQNVESVLNDTYSLLMRARAALVTSGTATLETALFDVPQVICYKGSKISYQIAKRLVHIKFIGLTNLILDKEVVKELIQHEFTVKNLTDELNKLLYDAESIHKIRDGYKQLHSLLKQGGNASDNAAKIIVAAAGKSIATV
jgi:lipid-A-disaccharide synthase